jgi:iron transport multicopper oxidase
MFDHDSLRPNVTSWLVYNPVAPKPEPQFLQDFYPWEDTDLVPVRAFPPVEYDTLFNITANFTNINGINFAIINDNTYQSPNCPAMFTALTTGTEATNPSVYGNVTNTFILPHLHMIWLVVNNEDSGGHPCTPPHNSAHLTF